MKGNLDHPELAKAVGKHTLLRLDWQDWKTLPPEHEQIFVIIQLTGGYYAVTAEYYDEIIQANGPFKKSHWQTVRFDEWSMPKIFLHDKKNAKRLIAWARPKAIKFLVEDCLICKKIPCVC